MAISVNLGIGCLDIIENPIINNTRKAISKSNIKEVQINNVEEEFHLVITHKSWSKGVNEDLHLPLSYITNQPTWTNNLAGAQNCINDVVAWLNLPIGGMGSGDASEATLQQVNTKLGNIDTKVATEVTLQNILNDTSNIETNSNSIDSKLTTSNNELITIRNNSITIVTHTSNTANSTNTISQRLFSTIASLSAAELLNLIENHLKNNAGTSISNLLTSTVSTLSAADILEAIANFLANIETNSNFLSSIDSTLITLNTNSAKENTLSAINNKINNTDLGASGVINGNGQNVATIITNGHNTGSIQVVGTFVGTLQIQITVDGTTWVNINGSNSIVNAATSVYLTSGNITTQGIFQFDIGGVKRFRVISTTWTSGTANIFTNASTATSLIAAEGIEGTQAVSQSGTWNVSNSAGTNLIGDIGIQYRANATGAASIRHIISTASTNATIVKASAGRVIGYCLSNLSASYKFVKLHNQTTSPTAGSGVVKTIAIPPNGNVTFNCAGGIGFSTGITLTIVNGSADNDTTPVAVGDVVGDLFFS
jgi:hypothetical protein